MPKVTNSGISHSYVHRHASMKCVRLRQEYRIIRHNLLLYSSRHNLLWHSNVVTERQTRTTPEPDNTCAGIGTQSRATLQINDQTSRHRGIQKQKCADQTIRCQPTERQRLHENMAYATWFETVHRQELNPAILQTQIIRRKE